MSDTAFSRTTLFNCCTGNNEPNWQNFSSLEIGGCSDLGGDTTSGRTIDAAEFFTVYGRKASGEVEAITDITAFHVPFRAQRSAKAWQSTMLGYAVAVAAELGRRSGLPVTLYRLA